MSKENVIGIARGELGVTEDPPGSNRTKYWEAYDPAFQGQPWCVCFLWWVFRQAGEAPAFFGGGRTASCTRLLRWYREHGCTAAPAEAEAGDILLLNFRGGTEPEHCALAVKREGNVVFTIEGNTTPGWSGSHGDQDHHSLRAEHRQQQCHAAGMGHFRRHPNAGLCLLMHRHRPSLPGSAGQPRHPGSVSGGDPGADGEPDPDGPGELRRRP